MKTFSIYRGQARTGIGEGPGHPVPHGEQYLAADPPLDEDGALLSAARPWMTLDWRPADEQALGDRIEAWSYFRHGGLRIVVRLSAAGTYDRRTAYFAQGRAFSVSEIAGACDPGAWLGRSEVFEEPWRDVRGPARPGVAEPEMVRPAQVLEEPAVAGALLAHFYQGLVAGYPIVMAVPTADFAAGSPIHALVSFARAALPLSLKTDCRIRVFTRLPDLFLRTLQADLIVVPENEAGNALAARRDATLLDRKGARREGRDLSREAAEYAEAVLRRVVKLPDGLLAFSGAISRYLPKDRLPGEQEIARIPAVYNLLAARTDPARLGEWLRTSLLKQVNERPTGLAWDLLIRPEDWHGLAFGDLAEILVTDARSDEARTLLQLAEAEARRPERRELVSEEWLRQRWSELPPVERLALLARLLGSPETGRPLVAADVAARLSSSLPLSDLLASGSAAPLLEAERQTGLLGGRAGETADLAAAAGRDLGSAALLAQATAEGVLPTDWALRLLRSSDEIVVRAAAAILPVAVTSLCWLPVLDRLFDRLLEAPPPPPVLRPSLVQALDRTDPMDPASGLKGFLVLTELLVRSRASEGARAIDRAWQAAETLSDRDERYDFVNRVIDPGWQSLQPDRLVEEDGSLRLSWTKDFANLLLGSAAVREHLDTRTLLALADRQADLGPWLNPRMAAEPDQTTTALLRAHRWSSWRKGSALTRNALRNAALAWLGSEVWQSRHAPQARLEEWKQVVADLAELTGQELRDLFFEKPARPRWPWITPFQDEQIRDLCGLAQGDLGVLAELAETLDWAQDPGYVIPGTPFEHLLAVARLPQTSELPSNALAFLSSSSRSRPVEPLPLRQAALLFDQTRHRRERAAAVLYQAIEKALARDPLSALQTAERLAPWSAHPQLLDVIERWRGRQPSGSLDGDVQALLQRNLLAAQKTERSAVAWNPAALDPALRALLQKSAADDCWKRLGKAVAEYVKAGGRKPHPVSGLVEQLRKACPQLPPQERRNLEHNGWDTLGAVLKSQPLVLREPLQREAALPVLELASLLLPHLGTGGVALRLLFLEAARDHARQESWWVSLVAGVASCCRRGGPDRPPDREEAALCLILQSISDLPASEARTAGPILEARLEQILNGCGPRPRGIYAAAPREIRQGAAQ